MSLTQTELQEYAAFVKDLDETTDLTEVNVIGRKVGGWTLKTVRAIPAGLKAPAIAVRKAFIFSLRDKFEALVKTKQNELLPEFKKSAGETIYGIGAANKAAIEKVIPLLDEVSAIIGEMLDAQLEVFELGRQLERYDNTFKPQSDFQVSGVGLLKGSGNLSVSARTELVVKAVVSKYFSVHFPGTPTELQKFIMPSETDRRGYYDARS